MLGSTCFSVNASAFMFQSGIRICDFITPDNINDYIKDVVVDSPKLTTYSVSCLKLTWNAEQGRDYEVVCYADEEDYAYYDNITYVKKDNGKYFITGLRENTSYSVKITPLLSDKEKNIPAIKAVSTTCFAKTEEVEVIWDEFPYEEGWTSCYCGERASGLTRAPSWGAIQGTLPDEVTDTGVRRNEYGDYCCAMGLFYGTVGDRFLVENEGGEQFTVSICDSKGWCSDADGDGYGDGRFHWYNGYGNGKCVIEFIYDDDYLPPCVKFSGSWGFWNWNGLDLGWNIASIKKINYGDKHSDFTDKEYDIYKKPQNDSDSE